MNVDVVIPCYRVSQHIRKVVEDTLAVQGLRQVIVVDDACPEHSSTALRAAFPAEPRLVILEHSENKGVGGAMLTGYAHAFAHGAEVVVKLDGDGQMRPSDIPLLLGPILRKEADYAKGNRFFYPRDLQLMPNLRLFGNAVLSLINKFSSGYWAVMDPTNGFTALHKAAYQHLDLPAIEERYFFESDMLYQLGIINAAVRDVPLPAIYGTESSSLNIPRVLVEFPRKYLLRLLKRIGYKYYVREFNIASLEILFGLPSLLVGAAFGGFEWYRHFQVNEVTPPGTVMIVGLLILIGFQLLLSAVNYDITHEPSTPLQQRNGDQ